MTTRGQKRTNQIAASLDATDDTANNAPSTNKRTKKPTRKVQANASANSRASTGASANIDAQSSAEASTNASISTGPVGIDSAGATSSNPIQVDAIAAIQTQLGEMQRQITQAHQNTERERVRTQQLEVQLAEANRPHSTPPVSQPMAPATAIGPSNPAGPTPHLVQSQAHSTFAGPVQEQHSQVLYHQTQQRPQQAYSATQTVNLAVPAAPVSSFAHMHGPGSNNHAGEGPLALSLYIRHPGLDKTLVGDIFWTRFSPRKHLGFLSSTWPHRLACEADMSKAVLKRPEDLWRGLSMYCIVVTHFAHPYVKADLQEAFLDYQAFLAMAFVAYSIDSVIQYNEVFMNTRIHEGQDIPLAWRTPCQISMATILKVYVPRNNTSNPPPQRPALPGGRSSFRSCNKFNIGEPCVHSPCPYPHICSSCQGNHPAKDCLANASSSNSIPLRERVSGNPNRR